MLKIFKQILLPLALTGLMANSAQATNTAFDFSVTPIAENVYSLVAPSFGLPTPENKGWNSNSHFVVTDKGVLVFDTGSSESIGKEIKKAIKSVTDKPVLWVVNSHSHADHWLGNAAFANSGAEIIASSQATKTMKKYGQQDIDAFSRMTKGATGTTEMAYPASLLAQREKRNLAGVDVEFIFSNNGHSPGDVLMWLPKQKIIFGGDVLNSDWMPIMTPHANIPNLIDTLYAVVGLNPAVVLTGHGSATTVKSVKRDADLLTGVWKLVKDGYKENKKQKEILSQANIILAPKYKALYKNFDSQLKQQVKQMYKKQKEQVI
ncbi:MBL fold metallo-hydrolase [Thalassomonas actiniarum]|uniref:MBL fold metallo-hydrolase n=1 Tax=Thalassomonas actiniarum TaxID=485447 RepID=A0AAF0C732_9GAMM|nr:MBL fold metallo-hydrolase [Thalassomonas actiniarum]WDE02444.1 MBL fold metallo-hydrolase [Thalassomonas actiniarum]